MYGFSGKIMTSERSSTLVELVPGRVYRTREFAAWSTNAPRLVKRLAAQGQLVPLAHGLYCCPRRTRFGLVPPTDAELMRAFLDGGPFLFTGPEQWNALGLGTTALFSSPLVYNTKRSGVFEFGGRKLRLRRVAFPSRPSPEWYVVDLFEHAGEVGVTVLDLTKALKRRLRCGAFVARTLRTLANRYGTRATRLAIEAALEGVAA